MSPEKQRVAIATACGWKYQDIRLGDDTQDPPPHSSAWHFNGKFTLQYPPDYLNDLNACHEMEQVLTHDQHIDYMEWLGLCSDDYGHKVWAYVHATSAERCKAFLRTLGLWEDAQ